MQVTESMGPAWEATKRVLFRPFNIGTWFSFGVIFFLQSCIEGGGNGFNLPGGGGGGGSDHGSRYDGTASHLSSAWHHLTAHLPFADALGSSGLPNLGMAELAVIAVIGGLLAIPFVLLALWLGTRGQMMAIQGVASGRPDVGVLWRSVKAPATRLFKFHLAMLGISLLILVPVVSGGALVAISASASGEGLDALLPIILVFGLLAFVLFVPVLIVYAMARNFVAPVMLKHGVGAREGWRRFWAVGRNHLGAIIGFFLLRFLVAIGAGIVSVVAGLFTCCLGFLPVLHQTLMAPYYVFERAWTLEALASISPDLDLRGFGAPPNDPPPPPYGSYNPYGGSGNPYAPPGYGPPAGGFGGAGGQGGGPLGFGS